MFSAINVQIIFLYLYFWVIYISLMLYLSSQSYFMKHNIIITTFDLFLYSQNLLCFFVFFFRCVFFLLCFFLLCFFLQSENVVCFLRAKKTLGQEGLTRAWLGPPDNHNAGGLVLSLYGQVSPAPSIVIQVAIVTVGRPRETREKPCKAARSRAVQFKPMLCAPKWANPSYHNAIQDKTRL